MLFLHLQWMKWQDTEVNGKVKKVLRERKGTRKELVDWIRSRSANQPANQPASQPASQPTFDLYLCCVL
jgi:hypothetical protein